MVTTKNKYRAEKQNIKKEETEENIIENHQTKRADRKTQKKKQWRYRATRKKKIKGSTKSLFINNHPKCKWIEFTNQKTQSG